MIDKILEGTFSVLPIEELKKKLNKNIPLNIKLGADPTAPDLHLGHAVVLSKLKDLQDLGHRIIFIIGDFTARIGDPTGKSKTRPPLSEEQIQKNKETYINQLGRILDMSKVSIRFNSEWLDLMTSRDWIKLCGNVTLARIIEREDFKKRLNENTPIGLHELLYPMLQAYDSVILNADVEIGGTDQTFNLMMGRFLQEQIGQEPQVVITMPLLEGLDGVNKMSKSLNNYIGLTEEPNNVFGKIMSISDNMMWRYYEVVLRYSKEKIEEIKNNIHPIENKKNLAYEILIKFWSKIDAENAKKYFENNFQEKKYENLKEFKSDKNSYNIVDIVICIDNTLSRSEAKRLILSNSVSINDIKINDIYYNYSTNANDVFRVGKHRIYKVII